jgi:hypothetical protein
MTTSLQEALQYVAKAVCCGLMFDLKITPSGMGYPRAWLLAAMSAAPGAIAAKVDWKRPLGQ